MEQTLERYEKVVGTWDDEHVKALLHFPRFPMRLIQQEPWQAWIGERGGLKAVYAYLRGYPHSPSHRRILDVVLSNPEAIADFYANELNVSRATYFYQLRELVPALVQTLNCWEVNSPSPTTLQGPSENIPPVQPTLPVPLTNLVGVESALQSLIQLLLREDVRLLTLLGTGGIGKTRLSIELTRRLGDRYGSEVCFVDLSALRDHTQVGQAIAQTLGLKEEGEPYLKAYLRPKEFLLVLDNFECLLPARALITELLATAPRLKILVTSRAPLHVYGEHEFVVPPLAMPDIESVKDPELWAQSPAVALFVQRAQAVNPAFTLNSKNIEAVVELCLRMEGIPLAIELTAFQVKYFSPQAMLVRLSNVHRLNFLSHVPKQLPPHQQTMRDMLNWSYDLLSPDLQTLFCRLAVFPGGFTMEAAEAICADQAGVLLDVQVGLTALADQSLLEQRVDTDGEPRFHMLGMTREYAQEQLQLRGEKDALEQVHTRYYLQLAEEYSTNKATQTRETTFLMLQREYANLRAAIQWAIDHREGELGLRFVVVLWDFWKSFGDLGEGRQFTQSLLEQTVSLRLPIRGRVLRLSGWLAHDMRDHTTMLWAFQASHELSKSLGDRCGVGLALHGLGELAQLRGQPEQAREHLEQSLKLFDELENKKHIAWSLDLLGRVELSRGNLSEAQAYFEKSLDSFRGLSSISGLTLSLVHLGQSLFYQGLIDQATPLFEECLHVNREAGKTRSSSFALALNYLSEIAVLRSQPELARELNGQSLKLSKNAGYDWCVELGIFTAGLLAMRSGELESAAFCFQENLNLQQSLKEHWRSLAVLEATAELSVARREWLGAARLFGVAESLQGTLGILQMPVYRQDYESSLATLKEQIDAAVLTEARSAGQALSLEQALAYALRCLE